MGLGEVQVVNKLASLNELGAEALMIFVEGKACTPEWSGPHATLQFSEQSQRSTVLPEIHEQRVELAGQGEYRNVRIKQSWIQKQLGSARNHLSALRWILFRR